MHLRTLNLTQLVTWIPITIIIYGNCELSIKKTALVITAITKALDNVIIILCYQLMFGVNGQ